MNSNTLSNKVSSNRIEILDSLRGLAAFVVVIHHSFVLFPGVVQNIAHFSPLLYFFWETLSGLNKEAVLFFFILSGFSIAMSSSRLDLTSPEGINTYLYKRFKRILPLYWMALLITLIVGFLGTRFNDPSFSLLNLTGNLLMLQVSAVVKGHWFIPYGLNGPLWSISYEMFYYLFFIPWIFLLLRKPVSPKKLRLFMIAAICISILAVGIQKIIFIPWLFFLNSFMIWYFGVYIFQLFKDRKTDHLLFGCILFFLVFYEFFVSLFPKYSIKEFSSTLSQLKNGLWVVSLFYFGFAISQLIVSLSKSKGLSYFNKFWKPIGDGSYTLYLIHYPVLLYLSIFNISSAFLLFLILFILVLFTIIIENWFVNQRFLWLKRNYLRVRPF